METRSKRSTSLSPSPVPLPRASMPARARGGEGFYVYIREVPRELRRGANYRYYWRAFLDGTLAATGLLQRCLPRTGGRGRGRARHDESL